MTVEQFWTYVEKTDGCWLWRGGKAPNGYGLARIFGKQQSVHRASWKIANGEIPNGLFVLHRCDVKACVRPDHLFLGTQADNMADKIAKGRAPTPEQCRAKNPRYDYWKLHPERIRRGDDATRRKLNSDLVARMRELHAGGSTFADLARQFGVTRQGARYAVAHWGKEKQA